MASAGELIRKYVEHSDQGAFTELVRLHVNLVYSVALRQAYGDTALAEDITQEVFALMARKAPELANRPTLTGWLYRSALLVTNSTIRREQRRKVHEHRAYLEATMMNSETTGPAGQGIWGDAKPALDRAMGHLSERERDALLLRFFESRSFPEIGEVLQISEDAARRRVDRALDKLRVRLSREVAGTSTIAALAALLAESGATAAPISVVAK